MISTWPLESTDDDVPLPPPWDGDIDLEDKETESALLSLQYEQPELALRICRAVFCKAEANRDEHTALHALYLACSHLYNRSQHAAANRAFNLVRKRAQGVAKPWLSTRIQLAHSSRLTDHGEHAQAMVLRQNALAMAMALGDDRLTHHALGLLAQSAISLGDAELTLALVEQQEHLLPAEDILASTSRSYRINMVAMAWKEIARVHRSAGSTAAAEAGLHKALECVQQAFAAAKNDRQMVYALGPFVEILLQLDDAGRVQALMHRLRAALRVAPLAGDMSWVALQLASAKVSVHDGTVGDHHLKTLNAIEALQGSGSEIDLYRNHVQETLQAAHESLGHYELALAHHKRFTELHRQRHTSKVRQRLKLLRHTVFAMRAEAVEFIAHDLLTPLAAAQTWVQALQGERLRPALLPPLRQALEQLRQAINMSDQYLGVLRAELTSRADLQVLNLGALADDVCENAPSLKTLGLRLMRDIDIGTHVLGDATLLTKALTALLADAVGRATSGTVVELRLTRNTAAGQALLSISHQGPGPTDAVRTRLHQQFADGKVFGAGEPGLALAAKVARLHRARLRFEDLPGQGSRLWLAMKLENHTPMSAA